MKTKCRLGIHDWEFESEWGYTYQQLKCKDCGRIKVISHHDEFPWMIVCSVVAIIGIAFLIFTFS